MKEPEGYDTKKKICEISNGRSHPSTQQTSLNRYFTGKGYVLGNLLSSSKNILGRSYNADGSSSTDVTGMLETQLAKNSLSENSVRLQEIVSRRDTATTLKNDAGLAKEMVPKSSNTVAAGNIELIDNDITVCVPCPVCSAYVPENAINSHLDSCLT